MISSVMRRWSLILFLIVGFLVSAGIFSGGEAIALASGKHKDQATEAATPTPIPSPAPLAPPAANWADVSAQKAAMKPGFESDVDQFVNANRYLIVATLSLESDAVIRASERVRYTNRTPATLKEIVFRLYPNTPALRGKMNVTRVTLNNKPVDPLLSIFDSVLTIPLDTPLTQGKSVEMTLDFNLTMTRGLNASYNRFGYINDVVSATAWYPTLSVYEVGKGWWQTVPSPQGDPAYTETGLYDVRLTAPADVVVAMSGKVIETTQNPDGTVTHRDVTGPMRDHAFMASTRYMVTPIDIDGTRLNIMHYKDRVQDADDGTEDVIKFAGDSFAVYNATFGEYPYIEFDVVENPTPTGVEFPGLVQIGERAWVKGKRDLAIIVVHEVGHQWFYALVGNNQVEHPWLDEGMARYTEFVYFRTTTEFGPGATGYIDYYRQRYNDFLNKQGDRPLDLPVSSYDGSAYGTIVYGKGALFIVELEQQLGQDIVNQALKEYVRRNRYRVATTADFQQAFEDVSGQDLDALFDRWVIAPSEIF